MSKSVLKLVVAEPFEESIYVREDSKPHSLHAHLNDTFAVHPDVVRSLISRFTVKGDLVIDPMCGSGTTILETLLMGRRAVGVASDRLSLSIARARIDPVDFAELAIALQFLDLKRPVDVRSFGQELSLFFDVETYCELVNLKRALQRDSAKSTKFIEFLTLGLLHGHTAGHLSVYTDPNRALTPAEQASLNQKRRQVPAYRPLVPRILRRGAALLKDGIPGLIQKSSENIDLRLGDPRDLGSVSSATASLSIVPLKRRGQAATSWLRRWFAGIETPVVEEQIAQVDFWNEVLCELARVTKSGGRAAFVAPAGASGEEGELKSAAKSLTAVVRDSLSRYWSVEGELSCSGGGVVSGSPSNLAVMVFRRK